MPTHANLCPHCSAVLPVEDAHGPRAGVCPVCQKPFARPEAARTIDRGPAPRQGGSLLVALTSIVATLAVVGAAYYSREPIAELWNDYVRRPSEVAELERLKQESLKQTQRPAPPRKVEEGAPVTSRVLVRRAKGKVPGEGRPERAVVVLESPREEVRSGGNMNYGILAREVVRQAFLITARENWGMVTRDEVLGEPTPTRTPDSVLEIASRIPMWKERPDSGVFPRVTASVRGGEGGGQVLNQQLARTDGVHDLYRNLLKDVETLSRSRFAEVLERAAPGRPPRVERSDAPVPADTERQLSRLNFLSQFAAVHDLHAAIRDDGESPRLLGALVRGYANLGVLTEHHWNGSHKVFKARSLLYAQRLVAGNFKQPAWALWHRAYANALSGLHQDALADLAESDRAIAAIKAGDKPSLPRPAWVEMISAFCRFDLTHLTPGHDGDLAELALLLRYIAVENPDNLSATLDAARVLLNANPECYRVHDGVCRYSGVSTLHSATQLALETFSMTLAQRLRSVRGLPDAVVTLLANDAREVQLTRMLIASRDDQDELPWSDLGRLIQEARFAQVWRRVHFMAVQWAVPVDEFLDQARPLIADHPLRNIIEDYGSARAGSEFRDVKVPDIELTARPLIRTIIGLDRARGMQLYWETAQHMDWTYQDEVAIINDEGNAPKQAGIARQLLLSSPHSPLAMAKLIEHDWTYAGPLVPAWEAKSGRHPAILGALGKQYVKQKRFDDAERTLIEYIKISPDAWAFEALAGNSKAQGHLDKWRQWLESSLEQDDTGLDHARVRVELARHYMGLARWAQAQPYADAAASSGAAWAMQCAVDCYEGLKDWERAESWARQIAERYPDSAASWLGWCLRTGHGDGLAAARLASAYYRIHGDPAASVVGDNLMLCCLLAKEPRRGLDVLRKDYPKGRVLEGLFLALLADEAGDATLRDETWEHLASKEEPVVRLAGLFRTAVAAGGRGPLDRAAVDALIASAPDERRRSDLAYFTGRFFQLHGEARDAIEYLTRCTKSDATKPSIRLLAAAALRDLGIAPEPKRQPDAKAPSRRNV